jgi:hypothetical protein
MAFNVDKMASFCVDAVRSFAERHGDESFYCFAIDANLLCLNSEERAKQTLKNYQENWERKVKELKSIDELSDTVLQDEEWILNFHVNSCGLNRDDKDACLKVINDRRSSRREEGCKYDTPEGIKELRLNTGDWEYQGFAEMNEEHGFDSDLYDEHYDEAMESDDGHSTETEYSKAMSQLISALKNRNAFHPLTLTSDFEGKWIDHKY